MSTSIILKQKMQHTYLQGLKMKLVVLANIATVRGKKGKIFFSSGWWSFLSQCRALCLRFVDDVGDIRETLILSNLRKFEQHAIMQSLEGFGLSLSELRGQGYDGASTMSGERAGVQALLREKQPKALYIHCAGHSLNLAIINSCSVPPIRNW